MKQTASPRREFLKSSIAVAAAAVPYFAWNEKAFANESANDRPRIGCIGVVCKYPGGVEMLITSRGENGVLFEGTKGRLFVNHGKITGQPIDENWDEGQCTAEVV